MRAGATSGTRKRRPARVPGSPERIAEQALSLIEAEGLEELSMRALAKRVGLAPMTLYHHFASRSLLLDAVMERLMGEVVDPAKTKGSLAERLITIYESYFQLGMRYPEAFVLLATRRFNAPVGFAFVEGMLAMFAEEGFMPEQAAMAFRVLGYYLNGAILAHLGVGERLRSARPTRLTNLDEARTLPHLTAAAPFLGPRGLAKSYELGIRHLVALVVTELPRH